VDALVYQASTWVLPVLLAVTLHEAAHALSAHALGDDTAYRLGRVTLNPLKHVDPFGTVLLPALLLITRAPFLFGWAKPVPVTFSKLGHPRRDAVIVAAAGPAANIALATAAALLFRVPWPVPQWGLLWTAETLYNMILLNAVLAVFNLLPIPPLDGGRIAVSILPAPLARPLARLEPYGLAILIALVFLLPSLGDQAGLDLDFVGRAIGAALDRLLPAFFAVAGLE
jgi:Zn-dependent protease